MNGHQEWIAKNECYICDRWQMTFFLYKPETRVTTTISAVTEGSEAVVEKKEVVKEEVEEDDEYYVSGSWESLM